LLQSGLQRSIPDLRCKLTDRRLHRIFIFATNSAIGRFDHFSVTARENPSRRLSVDSAISPRGGGRLLAVFLRRLGLRSGGSERRATIHPTALPWNRAMCDCVQTATELTCIL